MRGDLIKALTTLMKREKTFDHVLIETTGLADPAPVAFVRTLFRNALATRTHGGSAAQRPARPALRLAARQCGRSELAYTSGGCEALTQRLLVLCQTFFINQEVADFYRIDSILCLVDAKHVREHLQVRDAALPCTGTAVDCVGTTHRRSRLTTP